jgi:hypothetical protein
LPKDELPLEWWVIMTSAKSMVSEDREQCCGVWLFATRGTVKTTGESIKGCLPKGSIFRDGSQR